MSVTEIENIKQQSRKLLPDQKIELIKFLADSLAPHKSGQTAAQRLVYGKYRDSGRPLSVEADFKIAEWQPNEAELNGD
jgi:hypothetical protein